MVRPADDDDDDDDDDEAVLLKLPVVDQGVVR